MNKTRSQGELKNGLKQGPWVHFRKNGELFSKGGYVNGKREGEWVFYYQRINEWDVFLDKKVTVEWQGNYVNGNREGEWVFFDENGQLRD